MLEDEGEKDRGERVGVSNYYGNEIRNDLAAMKAREERASCVQVEESLTGILMGGLEVSPETSNGLWSMFPNERP